MNGLDPDLLRVFEEAPGYTQLGNTEAFLAATMSRVQRETKMRLIRRIALAAVLLTAGAIAAPYVANLTLAAAGIASISPLACAYAALIAWRIAHRAYSS